MEMTSLIETLQEINQTLLQINRNICKLVIVGKYNIDAEISPEEGRLIRRDAAEDE